MSENSQRGGPLAGVRVLEVAGLVAAPYGCMMLADMGADVIRIDRSDGNSEMPADSPLLRNRRRIELDLKQAKDVAVLLALADRADVLVEAFRPGVAERIGIGPDVCLQRNPKLVYARMTGWGQQGPMAQRAGHDLNYIGLTGLLHQIGPLNGKPVVPLNVIGDMGGGGLLLAFGIVCALLEARRSGRGQVVDAAMIDGALSFMTLFFGHGAAGQMPDRTGAHALAGAAHYYDVYETADGKHLAVAPIEPKFYRTFIEKLGLDAQRFLPAGHPNHSAAVTTKDWPALKAELQSLFKTRPRNAWLELFGDIDACVTPVLTMAEAAEHPHLRQRQSFIDVDGVKQPAPAPRFSRTLASHPTRPASAANDLKEIGREWGVEARVIEGWSGGGGRV